jgi:hypothetical protein
MAFDKSFVFLSNKIISNGTVRDYLPTFLPAVYLFDRYSCLAIREMVTYSLDILQCSGSCAVGDPIGANTVWKCLSNL